MARIRTIKPGFFTSEDVAALTFRARLTWIGLWTYVDDNGRGKANPRLIKASVWPLDDDVDIDAVVADLTELEAAGRVMLYEVDGSTYVQITKWQHQRIDRPTKSDTPAPPGFDPSPPPRDGLDESSTSDPIRKGREGKGREGTRASARPAPTCPAHPNGTNAPCRPCGDARRAHDAWRPVVAALPSLAELEAEVRCEDHGEVARLCPLCRAAARAGVA